jgi:hypothetical protein
MSQSAHIPGLPVKANPAIADFPDQVLHVIVCTEIIHHFNLHELRARILLQYRTEIFDEVVAAIIRGYHNRPQRSGYMIRQPG